MPRTEVVERVVEISDNVTIEIANRKSKVAGPKGTLPYSIPKGGFKYGNHPAVDRDSCWPPELGFCSTVNRSLDQGVGVVLRALSQLYILGSEPLELTL
jgi:hypothetical protein